MKRLLLLLLFVNIKAFVTAQESPEPIKKNTVFLEFFGNSKFLYSLNYDRILIDESAWKIAFRVGATFYSETAYYPEKDKYTFFRTPLEASYLRGRKNHYLELGLGVTYDYRKSTDDYSWQKNLGKFARIGYRYQNKSGGPFFKTGFTPLIDFTKTKPSIFPYAGLAFGYTF